MIGALLMEACLGPTSHRPEVHVFAASSLTEALTELEAAFEHRRPDVDVVLSFGGSQVLRMQIEQGATAHLFASANQAHADALVESGDLLETTALASNQLVVVTPSDNPSGLAGFDDLPRSRRLVIGTESVPLGQYTRQLLARTAPAFASQVLERVVSTEVNARLVRAKVQLGEADAGIVYRSDAERVPRFRVFPVPPDLDVAVQYVVGPTRHAPEAAHEFLAFVRGPAGQAAFAAHGFGPQAPDEP